MNIERLVIQNIRNIADAELSELGDVNLIQGENGAGKSSVLEAIHTLALARSFRSGKPEQLIAREAESALVRAELRSRQGRSHRLGVQRVRGAAGARCRLDGEALPTMSALAATLPAQVLDTGSSDLITGAPVLRRQLLDWGMFHVKQSAFHGHWQRFRRGLEQRNNLLRRGKISGVLDPAELAVWSREVADSGEALTRLREQQARQLLGESERLLEGDLAGLIWHGQSPRELRFSFYAGWASAEATLTESLERGVDKDRQSGFTHVGPHRADLRIRVDGQPAAQILSRGQLKCLAALLRLAQARLFVASRPDDVRGVFLVDDLPAELDVQRRARLAAQIAGLDMQVFATHIGAEDFAAGDWAVLGEPKRFHVKHGRITAL